MLPLVAVLFFFLQNRNVQVKSEFMTDFIMLVPRFAHR